MEVYQPLFIEFNFFNGIGHKLVCTLKFILLFLYLTMFPQLHWLYNTELKNDCELWIGKDEEESVYGLF